MMNRRLLEIDDEMRACRAELGAMMGGGAMLGVEKKSRAGGGGKTISDEDKVKTKLQNTITALTSNTNDANDLLFLVRLVVKETVQEAVGYTYTADHQFGTSSATRLNTNVERLVRCLKLVSMVSSGMGLGEGAAEAINPIATGIITACESYTTQKNASASAFLGLLTDIGNILKDVNYTSIPQFKPLLEAIGTALTSV